MTVVDIQNAILNGQLTEQELQNLNGIIVKILKASRKKKVAAAKQSLKVGMEVRFRHQQGTIIKINRTKCVVDTGGLRGRWSVPMTMCTPV